MSDPGLYTHLYEQLRDCAELIDQVIINLETSVQCSRNKEREALADLLRALQNAPSSNIDAALLANVLRGYRSTGAVNWALVADAIDKGEPTGSLITRLEELARVLELERADMHARMRGSHAR
jgi:hypothetical protein